MIHDLKTLPEYFGQSWLGNKTFEVRHNDRKFKLSDEVHLQEYDPYDHDFTGREIHGTICYITDYEQKKGCVVFQLINISLHG